MVRSRFGGALRQINQLYSGASVVGLSDASLLGRFVADHDEDAFAALVARHGPLVWAVCRDVLRDSVDVEDAFQATFLILVRRARSLRVEESLGGWLYRVAQRVAVRAKVDARRRRAKEQSGTKFDAVAEPSGEDGNLAELREAIARLPERYRQAVVLCELEGMTQVEAARALNCGEATLRRRLVAARERLRARLLTKHGEASAMLALARLSKMSSAPAVWGNRIPTEAAELLARKVGAFMIDSRLIKAAVALVGIGVATVATVTFGFNPIPTDEPKPAAKLSEMAKPLPPVRWVHLTTDTGGEVWANLDDGREFRKDVQKISLLQTESHDLFTYNGDGSIVKTKAWTYADVVDKAGRHIPPSVFELAGWTNLDLPQKASDEERKTASVFTDYEFETLDGRPCFRTDQFVRDALGEARIESQVWYDRETKRPVRARRRLQVALQHQYKREFETTVYDYPETGPADLAALGVPKDTPVVEVDRNKPSWKWADLPPEVRDALTAQADAVRRFPRDYRAVTSDFHDLLTLEYWSASQDFVDLWCDTKTGDAQYVLDDKQALHFRADNQEYMNRPKDLEQAIFRDKNKDLPVDRIVAWFPLDRSVNINLVDGKRTYNLTRLFEGANKPRRTMVHVLGGGFDSFPRLIEEQWPLLQWNRRYVTPAQPEADTPAGMIVIKVHQPNPEFRCVFTLDPKHDFIAVRQVEWSNHGDKWHKSDKRALRFKQLPGGSWYVPAWEERAQFGGTPDQSDDQSASQPDIQRVDITLLKPDGFPKEIFNGDKFVESARKDGAVIEVDQ